MNRWGLGPEPLEMRLVCSSRGLVGGVRSAVVKALNPLFNCLGPRGRRQGRSSMGRCGSFASTVRTPDFELIFALPTVAIERHNPVHRY